MSPAKRPRGRNGKFISKATQTAPQVQPQRPPASTHVLETSELLETILLNLPIKDFLLDQRVSKTWHSLINSSIRLRRALFLEPVSCGAISYIDWRLDDKDWYTDDRAQLSLGEHIRGPDRDQMPKIYPAHWGKTRDDAGVYRIFVNPLLSTLFPVLRKDGIYWNQQLEDLPESAQRENASWRKMYFTQPPVHCMAVEWDSEGVDGSHADWTVSSIRKARESKGLTMGEFFLELEVIGRPAWIEGKSFLEEYGGAEDLGRVVVGKS